MSVIDSITEWLLARERPDILELGTHEFRRIAGHRVETRFQLTRNSSVPAPRELVLSARLDHAVFAPEPAEAAILALFPEPARQRPYVAVILPDQAFFLATFQVPSVMIRTSPHTALEREVQKMAPLSYQDLHVRYETGQTVGNKVEIHVMGIPRGAWEDLSGLFTRTGLIPLSIQPSVIGLIGLLRSMEDPSSAYPSVLLHIGQEAATLAIYAAKGLRRITSLPIGMADFHQALRAGLGLTPEEAAHALHNDLILLDDPTVEAQREVDAYRVLEPLFIDLLQKLYGFLQLFTSECPQEGVFRRIVISGGGACLTHLDRLITTNLGLASVPLGTLVRVDDPAQPQAAGQGTTLGPALGALFLEPWRIERYDRMAAA